MEVIENTHPKSINRLISIDAFRGLAIALMLIADNPGNPARVYPQLRHAQWNGWTVADLAFPFFILIMGMAVPIATDKRLKRGDSWFAILTHIIIRSIGLFLVGILLNGFPLYDLSVIRIPGVLQRLGLVYLFTGLTYLVLIKSTSFSQIKKVIVELSLAFGIIVIYAWILNFNSVPEQGNLLQTVDLHFLKGHLYTPNWDPEGILSTFPAIASGLFGLAAGQILTHRYKKNYYSFFILLLSGLVSLFLGLNLDHWIPINKNIWSSTYVLFTSGFAFLLIALLYALMDIRKSVTLFKPFIILGGSPIVIYVLSELIRKTLWIIPITSQVQGKVMPMNVWLTSTFFTPWAGDWLDSFYFSIFYVLVWSYIMRSYSKRA